MQMFAPELPELRRYRGVPWDLGDCFFCLRCQGAEIGMWTLEMALVLHSTMISPTVNSGSFIVRFGLK